MKTVIYYYSATGCTKKIADAFAKGCRDAELISVTGSKNARADADLLVFAAPVYSGRIPRLAMDKFRSACLRGKAVVGIAVYGNITFGASLKQYKKLAKDHGCTLVGTGAFIGQHTFSTKEAPISEGRPNETDLQQAEGFGRAVLDKIKNGHLSEVKLPFHLMPRQIEHIPESIMRLIVKSPVIKGECIECRACAQACPRGAINMQTLKINNARCSRCFACVQACEKKARRSQLATPFLKYLFSWIGRKEKKNVWTI